jgi:hypothetical protein
MLEIKQSINKYYLKQIILIILFWLVIVIIPLKLFYIISNNGSLLIDYLVIVPILIFILLYNFIKTDKIKKNIIIVIIGFLLPYLYLLFTIYKGIIEGVNPKIL